MYKYKLSKDFMHYVSLCAVFPPTYNICKHWSKHEEVFVDLVGREGNVGIEHFMQALIMYFMKFMDRDFQKYASTCMYNLWQADVLSEKFILDFAKREIKLDKDSELRDKKAEKKFTEAIQDFTDFLQNTEAEEYEYDIVDEKEEEEETKMEDAAKLDADKQKSLEERKLKQEELAAKAKAQQQAAIDAALKKQAEDDEKTARMEESK